MDTIFSKSNSNVKLVGIPFKIVFDKILDTISVINIPNSITHIKNRADKSEL